VRVELPAASPPPAGNSLRWKAPAGSKAVEAPVDNTVVKAASLTLNAPETSKSKPATTPHAANEFRAKSTAVEPARLPERPTKHIGNWNKLPQDATVQRTAHETDPFVDPFAEQHRTLQFAQAPRAAAAVNQEPEPGQDAPAEEAIPAEPAPAPRPRSRFPLDSPADYPDVSSQPLRREPMTMQPQPRPDYLPAEESSDVVPDADRCQRIYNERNCCGTEKHCRLANDLLKKMPLSKISLDITPRFKLDATNWQDHDDSRDEVLKRAEHRKWYDREGAVVAEGRLTDLNHGHALITTTNGTVARLPLGQLGEDELCFINAWWLLPPECIAASEPFHGRNWCPATFTFTASALSHKPLYFEEVQAERYGHVMGPVLQPVVSGAHFFLNIALLPYKMGINPPGECQYALGYYRPGSCAPWMVPPVPLSIRGGLAEAGVIVGGVFLIP